MMFSASHSPNLEMETTNTPPAHPKVRHGGCRICGHYGDDCTGRRHTPLPWHATISVCEEVYGLPEHHAVIADVEKSNGMVVADICPTDSEQEQQANAELIETACNAYYDLVALARMFRDSCIQRISLLRDQLKEDFCDPEDIADQIGHWKALRDECDKVLAKAHGETA
jgi:hypothetical protein